MWSSGWVGLGWGGAELLFPFGYRWEADLLTVTYLRSSLPFEHRQEEMCCFLPRSIIFCLILPAPVHRCRAVFTVFFCLLCASHHAGEDRYVLANTGSESFVIHLRNKKLLVSPPCDDQHTLVLWLSCSPSLSRLDLISFCKIWAPKNADNGRRTEAKEENFLFSLNFRNVYWAAHYSLFACRTFTFPKPIMWSGAFWRLRSLFFLATFVWSDLPEGEPGSSSSGVQRVLFR